MPSYSRICAALLALSVYRGPFAHGFDLYTDGYNADEIDLDIDGDYADAVIEQHNIHRTNHSALALEWDATLAAIAQKHAMKCDFEHTADGEEGSQYGENLSYWASSGDIARKENYAVRHAITDGWYNKEEPFYTGYGYAVPPNYKTGFKKYGHFTQVVWKSSKRVGCGSTLCAAGVLSRYPAWYTVCNYDPPGMHPV
ncbi:hypothetical protein NLG97_g2191 [Lecanicillium saksenae]|uniref:Uncharacterized protein n=1 Tax=Lecanicillium saksenae TaxID=468837 RepID=A0ACC1R4X1_9HYPO|nr:hypothetical protein NLG97_g2191 [Lecanicillium saksenae]